MTWTATLNREFDSDYGSLHMMLDMIDDAELSWKPKEGDNWMNLGQLLCHLAVACGWCANGFVTGEWTVDPHNPPFDPEDHEMPMAADFPTVTSVAEARELFQKDEAIARKAVAQATEDRMENEQVTAPWGVEGKLGHQLLDCVKHLNIHKAQLFFYLKQMGKPVHTGTMYGMKDM